MLFKRLSSVLLLLLFLICGVISIPALAREAGPTASHCQSYNVPVALADGSPLSYTIYGKLCNPATGPSHTVQVLLAGGTYGSIYWDFPTVGGVPYSYVQAANAAGYSTFNMDRIGTGQSSHPDLSVVTVTMYSSAFVVHEIVQDLRQGLAGNAPFAHVILAGHSLGSMVAFVEAGTPAYHDVDGIIITGMLHHLNTVKLASAVASLYPASLDPLFAKAGYGVGYVTTTPGARGTDFYYMANVDPNVLSEDEATKDTGTLGEFATFLDPLLLGTSSQITVPVLTVIGQQDAIFCGLLVTDCSSNATLLRAEAPFYSSQAQLQALVVPGSGHDLNLQPGHNSNGAAVAPTWFASGLSWALRQVAP